MDKVFFAVHKGGDNTLDRVGQSTSINFRNIPADCFVEFVKWDISHNVMLLVKNRILTKGSERVPIVIPLCGKLSATLGD